jgi:5-formyltetrahydrofolate cyclo-ligase
MTTRRKIEEKVQALERQAQEIQIQLGVWREALKMLPKDSNGVVKRVSLRAGSDLAKAREAILEEGKPLHINVLLKKLGKPDTKDARVSLAGSMASYVRKNEVFTRPEPNTFGLLEMDGEKEEAPEGASED